MLANGDEVFGPGIPQGAKITGLSTGGDPDTADLTIAPTAGGTRTLAFMRAGSVGSGWLPTGSVHILGGGNNRFDGCAWQGVANSAGLSLCQAANTLMDRVYREYGSPYTSPLPFLTTFGNVENLQVSKVFLQSNTADPLLIETGDLTGFFDTLQNGRIDGVSVITNQNPPTLTNVIKLGSASDDLEIDNAYSLSSATGARFPLIYAGTGAGFIPVASVAGTITLPSPTAKVFSLTGTNAVTSITAQMRGRVVTLITSSTASLTNGSNLKLASNWPGGTNHSITLVSDGTNWIETGRS